MRKFLRPALFGLSAFLLGGAALFGFLRLSPDSARSLLGMEARHSSKPIVPALQLPQKREEDEAQATPPPSNARPEADSDVDDFLNSDPFAVARKMHEQMEKEMRAGFRGMTFSAGSEEVVAKEDDKSVSYEIKGVDGASLNTKVQNGYLTITGESKQEGSGFSFRSSFHRSFPLPRNVDPAKMETISEKDKVVLRFPKKNS